MASRQDRFFQAVAARQIPRIRVAGIVVQDDAVLVQRPRDEAEACYAFIGGEYEVGDSFATRLAQEFEEETTARLVSSTYAFCVENRFLYNGQMIQQVEHYFFVDLDRRTVESREPHLSQHWLPRADLGAYDLRPHVVRDLLAEGRHRDVRHLVQGVD